MATLKKEATLAKDSIRGWNRPPPLFVDIPPHCLHTAFWLNLRIFLGGFWLGEGYTSGMNVEGMWISFLGRSWKRGYVGMTFVHGLGRRDIANLQNMGKNRVVFVGFSSKSGFVTASTKTGLSKLIGVSYWTVMRNLEGEGKTGMVSKAGEVWWVCESVVSKLDRGKGGRLGNLVGGPVTSKNGK